MSARADEGPKRGRPPKVPGGIIGGFELIEKVGEGAMGVVYRARQVALDRTVALKILPEHLASNPEFASRFLREARAAAKLDHPNVVRAIDAGESGGRYYFAMEFVDGQPFNETLLECDTVPEDLALGIVMQIARGLECAWQHDLVHRDIKPENILITNEGVAKIADLGLAEATQAFKRASRRFRSHDSPGGPAFSRAPAEPDASGPALSDAAGSDEEGAIVGTPSYISPEQARAEDVDTRSDIYSLGVLYYRSVTGKVPFRGEDAISTITARLHETPEPANDVNPEVSDETALVIATMMARERDLRYPDPAVLLHDLERLAEGEEPEFAGATEARQERIVKEVRSQHISTGVPHAAIAVRRRRGRGTAFVAAGVVVAAAVMAAALVLRDRTRWTTPGAGGISAEELTRRERLEEEAAGVYAVVSGDFETGKYAEVVEKVDEAAARFAGTSYGPKLDSLRSRAAAAIVEADAAGFHAEVSEDFAAKEYAGVVERVDEAGGRFAGSSYGPKLDSLRSRADAAIREEERRRREEVERLGRREEQYRDLVKLAREALSLGDYMAAFGHLNQAKTIIKDTDELKALLREARRLQYLAGARDAERKDELTGAVKLYRLALETKPESKLEEHVRDLERRIALRRGLREAEELAGKEDWRGVRWALLEALGHARGDEAREIKPRLASAERDVRYLDLLKEATLSCRAGEWRKVLDAAREAAGIKPDAQEPKDLIRLARRALGPEKEITDSIGMSLVLVPAGEFVMGSDKGDPDERPRHEVRLDAYYIGKHEVTNAQFEQFESRHRRTEFSPADDMPVVAVSWRDAVAFCRWLSERESVEYRLPTEAEWEKAARGPSEIDKKGRTYPWGDEGPGAGDTWRCNVAAGENEEGWAADGHRYVSPVGSYPGGASPFGAHGLAGNVWEWCLDWYRADYYRTGDVRNPKGPASGRQRVLRGGSFGNAARHARCANRSAHAPNLVEACVGFRCVRALDPIFRQSEGEGE